MIEIILSPFDAAEVFAMAMERQDRRNGDPNFGTDREGECHALGAFGECAYARMRNVERQWRRDYVLPIEQDRDVLGVGVRTRSSHGYDLYLWAPPRDRPERWYVLLTAQTADLSGPFLLDALSDPIWKPESVYVRYWGKIHGTEAQIEDYWTLAAHPFPRQDCYVIPRQNLTRPRDVVYCPPFFNGSVPST